MKAHPMLFTGEMVRALLREIEHPGTGKTMTRRGVGLDEFGPSDTPGYDWTWRGQAPVKSIAQQKRYPGGCWQDVSHERLLRLCPYGQPGDLLYAKEAWRTEAGFDHLRVPDDAQIWFMADGEPQWWCGRYRHARFMPRARSRITLRITDVRVERVQDISEEDARREGVSPIEHHGETGSIADVMTETVPHVMAFSLLWDDINGKRGYPWAANPWVWVITFTPMLRNVDDVLREVA